MPAIRAHPVAPVPRYNAAGGWIGGGGDMYGLILAGGAARRLGGIDKALIPLGGRPLLAHVAARLATQCDAVILSANGDLARFGAYDFPIVADATPDYPGPLAGLLAGLDHIATHHPAARYAVSVPVDCPFLPKDYVAKLQDARLTDGAAVAIARSGGRAHHVAALWEVDLRHDLRRRLAAGEAKVASFIERHAFAYATWPVHPYDPFFNINTPEDLAEAERIVASWNGEKF